MSGPGLQPVQYAELLQAALREDLGLAGDLTTDAIVPPGLVARARLVARRRGTACGADIAASAFRQLDSGLEVAFSHCDGEAVEGGDLLLEATGSARGLLGAERVALNLVGRMAGIATATRAMVDAVAEHRAQVVCTRKTTPGLRLLEKHAVRAGGGRNHRFGLGDAVLVKDNHLALAGGLGPAVEAVRGRVGHLVKIEVEVDTLEQLDEALAIGVDAVLLDNMDPTTLREAVRRVDGRAVTEASGGITPESAEAVAASGVDLLSVGWLTHSAPALDVALEIEPL